MTDRSYSQRPLSRAQIIGTSIGVISMVAAALVAVPAMGAHNGLSGSTFESEDGNLETDDPVGHIDWETVLFDSKNDVASGSSDDAFGQGSKEDTACPAVVEGTIPPNKSDLTELGLYVEDGAFLHMFWKRVQDPKGTTNMDFEFNQAEGDCGNGVTPPRTVGDLLITYNLSKGGTVPVFFLHRWVDSGTCEASNSFPCWSEGQSLTDSGDATGSVNTGAIPSTDFGGPLDPFTFGEGSVDLSAVFPPGECVNFGSAYLKSRSSDSFTAALKDFIAPLDFTLQNCGTIEIIKDAQPDHEQDFDYTTTSTTTTDIGSFSLDDDGDDTNALPSSRTFENLLEGEYTVTETAVADWELTSLVCSDPSGDSTTDLGTATATIQLAATETVSCTFTNELQQGRIVVNKLDDDGNLEGGAVFVADPGTPSKATDDVTLTEVAAGVHCADGLSQVEWTVTETGAPDDHAAADPASQTVTVDNTLDCTGVDASTSPDLEFTNQQLHTVIVLVCHQADDTLAASDVDNGTDSLTTLGEGATLPDGVSEEDLCSLGGFEDKEHGDKNLTVDVGSDAHTTP